MNYCISYGNGKDRCKEQTVGTSAFCKQHFTLFHNKYQQYKKLDIKSSNLYNNLRSDNDDIEKCLNIYSALYKAYEARKIFREKAVHPSAYDDGHDMRIKIIWQRIEKCISIIEEIHIDDKHDTPPDITHSNQYNELDHEIPKIMEQTLKNQSISNERTRVDRLRKRSKEAIRKVNEMRKEEEVWSTFIPLARKEREERNKKVQETKDRILNGIKEETGLIFTYEDIAQCQRFTKFVLDEYSLFIIAGISNKERYLSISDKMYNTLSNMNMYNNLEQENCIGCLEHLESKGYDYLGRYMTGVLKIRELIDNVENNEFHVRVFRDSCDYVKIMFYVGDKTEIFVYSAGPDDNRNFYLKSKPKYSLFYYDEISKENIAKKEQKFCPGCEYFKKVLIASIQQKKPVISRTYYKDDIDEIYEEYYNEYCDESSYEYSDESSYEYSDETSYEYSDEYSTSSTEYLDYNNEYLERSE